MRDTTDLLRGVNVDMRRHWYDESHDEWQLETHDRNVLLIGTREQIMSEYDRLNSVKNLE